MISLFQQMIARLTQGEAVVLCSIIAASGSVPRGAGAKMAVFPDGSFCGTIGGGRVEYCAVQKALEVHNTGCDAQESFLLHPNQVQDIGMVCGGEVTVFFQRFDPENGETISLLRHILSRLQRNCGCWLIMVIEAGKVTEFGTWDDETGLLGIQCIDEAMLLPHLSGRSVRLAGEPVIYIEPLSQRGIVYIFGGGHVGRALCPVLASVGFRVCVVENRPGLCEAERFPGAMAVLRDDCKDILKTIPITKDDYVAIMTPGHADDRNILDQVLWTPARYIGVIGSRKKIAVTNAWLLERGHDPESLKRVTTPIGLPIQAQTPEEIAISIAAQLIAHRAAKQEVT
ncbi:MAG: XdhC family protein [Ruminococcaceae bacterium]|nr:XdhC family protein [Oscillospiraceae bacterium]